MRIFIRAAMILLLPLIPSQIHVENTVREFTIEETVGEHEEVPVAFLHDFERYFRKELSASGCPGAAMAIIKDDQLVYIKGFGSRKNDRNMADLPVDPHTVFRIGSLSKGFAGLLGAMLEEETYFRLEDPVQQFVPQFNLKNREQAQRIQIRHLLNHTTGLARHAYTNLTEEGLSLERIYPLFETLDTYGREGEYFAYQNTAFSIIEPVITNATGRSYEEMLQARIFGPANMDHASCSMEGLRQYDNIAFPHQFWRKRGYYVPIRLNDKYYNAVSAGGVNASIADMARYMQILLGNRPDIASEEVLHKVFEPSVQVRNRTHFPRWRGVRDVSYGLGWRILDLEDYRLAYHAGSVNDYRSEIALDRERKIGICVLFNAQNQFASKVIKEFFERYGTYEEFVSRHEAIAGL